MIIYMMRNRTAISFLVLFLALQLLNGCGYIKMSFKKAHAQRWSSLRARKAAFPERNFIIAGQLTVKQDRQAPLAVVAVSSDLREDEIVDMFMVDAPSHFSLYLPPATYELVVFADLNSNQRFESTEVVGRYGKDGRLTLSGDEGGVLTSIDIHMDLDSPEDSGFRFYKRVRKHTPLDLEGVTKDLGDHLFSDKMGNLGLYDPANFMRRVPSMLYTVEGDIDKVPVIFIHGIEGTPANWKYLAERLDRERFHPWFFYYPSGESLEKTAEVLYWLLEDKFPFEPVVLVAHSMGGLVSRATIDKYSRQRRGDYISMFISLSTPYDGVLSARAAVNNPVSAPSWIDIAPSSDFIERYVHKGMVPEHLIFHLLFAYGDDGLASQCSDGTIALSSQLEPRTQSWATSVFGYRETHGGILTSADVSEKLNSLLNSIPPSASHQTIANSPSSYIAEKIPKPETADKGAVSIDMPEPHEGQ